MRIAVASLALASLASLAIRVGATAALSAEIVTERPGHVTVADGSDHSLLVNCALEARDRFCSLPPGAPRDQPGWSAIKEAAIEQLDQDTVELSITLAAPPPTAPPGMLIYYWQFQDGCTAPSPTDKDGVHILWNGRAWSASWFVIGDCKPRRVVQGGRYPIASRKTG